MHILLPVKVWKQRSEHCAFLQKQAKKADNGAILPTTSHPFVPKTLA
jgi:hypothetical protein